MRILFVTIPFREYIEEIYKAISKELDAQVDVVYCDLQLSSIGKAVDKFCGGKLKRKYNKKEQVKQFFRYEDNEYDYIFVLVGRNIEVESLKNICEKQVKAKKILYLWDDVARIDTFDKIESIFDEIISFDTNDCHKYGFKFLPLFYCDSYCYLGENKDIDLSSIGGLHSSRESYLNKLNDFCNRYNLTNYFHLKATSFYIYKELITGKRNNIPNFIKYKEIPLRESCEILKRSVCVVDMPHPTQTGLTIRTIESLAAHTKLITTNKAIKEYDFYDENNILITDNECSNLTEDFIKKPYVNVDDSILEKYSLSSWVRKIFRGD